MIIEHLMIIVVVVVSDLLVKVSRHQYFSIWKVLNRQHDLNSNGFIGRPDEFFWKQTIVIVVEDIDCMKETM